MNNQKFVLILLASLFSSCEVVRILRYGIIPKQSNYKHFSQRKVNNQAPVFNFVQPRTNYQLGEIIRLPDKEMNSSNITLNDFVRLHKTLSFLIIRNDTLLYEYYHPKYSDTSMFSSFSVIKPVISTLIGIAIDEGKIKSVNDYITDYLPEFKIKKGFDRIKIIHLLRHTSGIKFTDKPFDPTSDNAKFYWGSQLRAKLMGAVIEQDPDQKFKYSSENTLLLGYLIEKVTGGTISKYLEDKIWKPLGMEAPGYWSLDRSDSLAIEKVFCCFQGRAIDFAKFARLYLNKGIWQGKQIVSQKWVEYSTRPDPAGNNKHFYNNNWGIGPLKYKSYYAVGLYGQYLYIYPEKNMIIVRFGNADLRYHPNFWQSVFLQIIDQLN